MSTKRARAFLTCPVALSTTSIAEPCTNRSDTSTKIPYCAGPVAKEVEPHSIAVGLVPSVIGPTPSVEDAAKPPAVAAAPPWIDAPAPKTDPNTMVGPPNVATEVPMCTGSWLVCGNTMRSNPFGTSRRIPSLAYFKSGSRTLISPCIHDTKSSDVLVDAPPHVAVRTVTAIYFVFLSKSLPS